MTLVKPNFVSNLNSISRFQTSNKLYEAWVAPYESDIYHFTQVVLQNSNGKERAHAIYSHIINVFHRKLFKQTQVILTNLELVSTFNFLVDNII